MRQTDVGLTCLYELAIHQQFSKNRAIFRCCSLSRQFFIIFKSKSHKWRTLIISIVHIGPSKNCNTYQIVSFSLVSTAGGQRELCQIRTFTINVQYQWYKKKYIPVMIYEYANVILPQINEEKNVVTTSIYHREE